MCVVNFSVKSEKSNQLLSGMDMEILRLWILHVLLQSWQHIVYTVFTKLEGWSVLEMVHGRAIYYKKPIKDVSIRLCDFIHSIICNYLSLFVTTTEKEASGNVSVSMDTQKATVDSMYVIG